jgi:pyruvate,water dikinase
VGTVQVVDDPAAQVPNAGTVLVCHTTDPSWAAYLVVASAVVIDVGSTLSHGAIIARELGVPCVINTGTGTRDLHDGETVRVDGSEGTVEVLA